MDDKDNLGNNALCIASVMGHTDVVKILIHEQLEKGSSLASIINYQNFEGSTPLMLSSAAGHLDVVRQFTKKPVKTMSMPFILEN